MTDVLSLASWVDGKDIATDIGNAMYQRVLNQEFPGVKMVELMVVSSPSCGRRSLCGPWKMPGG